ncbi:MAG: hypothetical protein R6U62_06920 [Bacteroidales bacterium]
MKAVFIVYNQALTERIDELLNRTGSRGFTQWQDVMGRGTHKGEPRMGTHTWPALNSAILSVVEADKADQLLRGVEEINKEAEQQGIRAFVWEVEKSV